MRVTIISTVLNEGEAIRRLLDSLLAQTRRPDEVVIVDGGSRDNTVAVIQEYTGRLPLRVLVEPGANISRGRNVAIAAATGEVIASVDAGVWLEPQWLEKLIGPLSGRWQMANGNAKCRSPSSHGHQLRPSAIAIATLRHQPSPASSSPTSIQHSRSRWARPCCRQW